MKLFLHIGTEKTGTSSIQDALVRNSDLLTESGIHVLRACGDGNARALPAICMQEDKYDDYLRAQSIYNLEDKERFSDIMVRKISEEISSLPSTIHSVIISSEHFHSRLSTQEEVSRVKSILDAYFSEIEVMCYLREQTAMCISHYSTAVKTGNKSTLSDFVQKRCTPENPFYNFNNFLTLWEIPFGHDSMNVRLFDREFLTDADLLTDFFSVVALDDISSLDRGEKKSNTSLTPTGQALCRAINRNVDRFKEEGGRNRLHSQLVQILDREYSGSGEQLPHEERLAKFNEFKHSNEKLKATYFPDRPFLFSEPKMNDDNEIRLPPAKLERVLTELIGKLV